MDMCKTTRPPLYRESFQRVASCFLYRDATVLPGEELGNLFTQIDQANKDEKNTAVASANGSDGTVDADEPSDQTADSL